MDRTEELGKAPIGSLLLRFSLPAIVGMMVNAIYNVVDRIFIGQGVGPLGLAGATVAFPLMLILMAFGMLVGMGGSALVSIRLGEKKRQRRSTYWATPPSCSAPLRLRSPPLAWPCSRRSCASSARATPYCLMPRTILP
jgi:Na+-driven multidrug efflux pump